VADEEYTYDIEVDGAIDEVVIKEAEVVMIDVDANDVDGIELDDGTELVRDKLAVGTDEDVPVSVTMGVKLENVLLLLTTGGTDVSAIEEVVVPKPGSCLSARGKL
jgi:hypothetical protein